MRWVVFLRRRMPLIVVGLIIVLVPVVVTVLQGTRAVIRLDPSNPYQGTRLYDQHGELFAVIGRRSPGPALTYEEIPEHVVYAVVAIEDTRFWSHRGVDILGIARASFVNVIARKKLQGASTVTQQITRNLFLSHEKTFIRKFKEAIYALILEMRFTKRDIMALYVNYSYFGEGAYGIVEASQTYFGKHPKQLTFAEGALLIGLLKSPNNLSPYKNIDAARQRRNLVLQKMEDLNMIPPEAAREAKDSPIVLTYRPPKNAPYFIDAVQRWLTDRFGPERTLDGGLKVWTTIDPRVQKDAERALGTYQGAIVSLDPATGAIRALVGGRDYAESEFNRATDALRQPGSTFKPFIVAAALERGWTISDIVDDRPRSYGDFAPRNARDVYYGNVTMNDALAYSLNNGVVWLLDELGPRIGYEIIRRLGITTLIRQDRTLSLALGGITNGVTPLELTAAYAPLANGGFYVKPFIVHEVKARDGTVIYKHEIRKRRVLSEETAYFVTHALGDAVRYGTGRAAFIDRPQAGKTGTTNESTNAWFVGYTPHLVASVYVGEDEPVPLNGDGGTLAAPIWKRFAEDALKNIPPKPFVRPRSIDERDPFVSDSD